MVFHFYGFASKILCILAMGDENVIKRFHREHESPAWSQYQATGNKREKFVVWLKRVYLADQPDASVVTHTAEFALLHNLDSEPYDDHILHPGSGSESSRPTWPMKINDLYLEMQKEGKTGRSFTRNELFSVLQNLLIATSTGPEEMKQILDGVSGAPNDGLLQLIRDLTKD